MKSVRLVLIASLVMVSIAAIGIVSAQDGSTANVEIRVWQHTGDPGRVWISARSEGGSWDTLGTIPLSMEEEHRTLPLRYEDITLAVPVSGVGPPTPTVTPWVDPRPDNTYTLQQLATMPLPTSPLAPPKPRHVLALEFNSPRRSVRTALVDDPTRVSVRYRHIYDGRPYQLLCDTPYGSQYVSCEYSGDRPLSDRGTSYLDFSQAWGRPKEGDRLEFISATLDGDAVSCEQQPTNRSDAPFLWCYNAAVYEAWEAARDRALQPATDPLERYLRKEAGPPLWWQDSPYTAEGPYTTGVFEPQPYITYTISRVNMPGTSLNGSLVCVPFEEREGIVYVDTAELASTALWLLGPVLTDKTFYVRAPVLCEFKIENEGEWGFTLSASD